MKRAETGSRRVNRLRAGGIQVGFAATATANQKNGTDNSVSAGASVSEIAHWPPARTSGYDARRKAPARSLVNWRTGSMYAAAQPEFRRLCNQPSA